MGPSPRPGEGFEMTINAYTVQKVPNGYWITRLAKAGDRALPTNLEIEPTPLRSVARTILDDCGYSSRTDVEAFAESFLANLTDSSRVVTSPAPKIDRWVATRATKLPF